MHCYSPRISNESSGWKQLNREASQRPQTSGQTGREGEGGEVEDSVQVSVATSSLAAGGPGLLAKQEPIRTFTQTPSEPV